MTARHLELHSCKTLRFRGLQPWRRGDFPEQRAVSTGRCNTGLQFTRRRFKAQGLSRALIQAQRYLVKIDLRVDGQVGLLREVLS